MNVKTMKITEDIRICLEFKLLIINIETRDSSRFMVSWNSMSSHMELPLILINPYSIKSSD